jgi:hypothetical protein
VEKAYRRANETERQDVYDLYDLLVGPNGFECLLTEPEDRCWYRDGQAVIDKLNEQHDLLQRALAIIVDAIMHGMPVTQEVADIRNAICGVQEAKGNRQ